MRLGRRKFSPLLALLLAALWLLLNQSAGPGDLVLALVLGSMLAWAASALRPLQARVRRWDLAVRLALTVLHDIVRSNVAVAGIVLGLAARNRPGFLHVPLELRDPHGLAALAIIITATPGTVWVGVSTGGETLTLHVLDLENEARWVRFIKERYEQPLLRIFE